MIRLPLIGGRLTAKRKRNFCRLILAREKPRAGIKKKRKGREEKRKEKWCNRTDDWAENGPGVGWAILPAGDMWTGGSRWSRWWTWKCALECALYLGCVHLHVTACTHVSFLKPPCMHPVTIGGPLSATNRAGQCPARKRRRDRLFLAEIAIFVWKFIFTAPYKRSRTLGGGRKGKKGGGEWGEKPDARRRRRKGGSEILLEVLMEYLFISINLLFTIHFWIVSWNIRVIIRYDKCTCQKLIYLLLGKFYRRENDEKKNWKTVLLHEI